MRTKQFSEDEIEKALRGTGGLRSRAAQQLGCVLSTVSNYINGSEHLQEVEREIIEGKLDFCEDQLMKNIEAGKEPSLFKYLDAKGKHRGYGKHVIETSGPGGGPIQHLHTIDFDAMTDDELDAALADHTTGS